MEVATRLESCKLDQEEPQKGCWKIDLNDEGGACDHFFHSFFPQSALLQEFP